MPTKSNSHHVRRRLVRTEAQSSSSSPLASPPLEFMPGRPPPNGDARPRPSRPRALEAHEFQRWRCRRRGRRRLSLCANQPPSDMVAAAFGGPQKIVSDLRIARFHDLVYVCCVCFSNCFQPDKTHGKNHNQQNIQDTNGNRQSLTPTSRTTVCQQQRSPHNAHSGWCTQLPCQRPTVQLESPLWVRKESQSSSHYTIRTYYLMGDDAQNIPTLKLVKNKIKLPSFFLIELYILFIYCSQILS